MASVFQSVGASVGWRNHQLLAEFENESPMPDKFRKRCNSSSLNTLRMSLRKRMPLKQVEVNINENPTWESLEAKEKRQTLQTITRTAKNAFGAVSQKIQKSCQSTTLSLVTPPAKASARSDVTSSAKKRGTPPRSPRRKNRLATTTTPLSALRCTPRSSKRAPFSSGSAKNLVGKEWRSFSRWLGKEAVPLRRSRRAAALKSPYSSPMPASRRRCYTNMKVVPCPRELTKGCGEKKYYFMKHRDRDLPKVTSEDCQNGELMYSWWILVQCLSYETILCRWDVMELSNAKAEYWDGEVYRAGEFDCELESVSLGIRRLKRLSQVFDDVIVREEREQAISNYQHLMLQNLQSVHRSWKPTPSSIRRRLRRFRHAPGTWNEMALSSINNL